VVVDRVRLQRDKSLNNEINCHLQDEPRGLSLAPGRQWQGEMKCGLQTGQTGWRMGRRELIHRLDWQALPHARFPYEMEIAQLELTPSTPAVDPALLRVELRERYGVPYWLLTVSLITVSTLVWLRSRRRNQIRRRLATVAQRHAERMLLAGKLGIWPVEQSEPDNGVIDLSRRKSTQLDLVINPKGRLEIAQPVAGAEAAVARLSGHLVGAAPDKAEAGKVEFRLEAMRGHRLAYEACGTFGSEWREAPRVTLCDRDLIEIDGRWRLRYVNHRLRTRAEVESADRK
jgi:hypothetical protein